MTKVDFLLAKKNARKTMKENHVLKLDPHHAKKCTKV